MPPRWIRPGLELVGGYHIYALGSSRVWENRRKYERNLGLLPAERGVNRSWKSTGRSASARTSSTVMEGSPDYSVD